ncbi:hypothetical protein F5Y15DRAFT_430592 [Xylariaceae sp. FL0016]|nr:hypothetical protein F5Y15DRAFT_430592 [Xylariaceae sp. FL0016]
MIRIGLLTLPAALWLSSAVSAARVCDSTTAAPTYQWRITDARFDGADPAQPNGTAIFAASIVPGATSTFFECVAEWPEAWDGWYGDGNIIWSDCIWSGAGPTNDTSVSFALDWKNRTMYLSHSFSCSDHEGLTSFASGSMHIDMDCPQTNDTNTHCTLKSGDTAAALRIDTKSNPVQPASNGTCADNEKTYQSWELQQWHREYDIAPGSTTITPSTDTGPSFTLKNLANNDAFNCSSTADPSGTFSGACASAAEDGAKSTAKFMFDPATDVLTISQQWTCGNSSSFDAVGVVYVQASCSRSGIRLTCDTKPLWIGTKTT